MLSPNQIPGFFDHQYPWKECMNIFNFLQGYIHQGKVVSEVTASGWVCPGMPNHAQPCPNLPRLANGPCE